MRRFSPMLLPVFLALFLLGGCSDDNPVASQALTGDASAASSVDDTNQGDPQQPNGPMQGRLGLPGPLVREEIPQGGTYDTATGWFLCAPENDEHGATIVRSYAFFDAAGEPQEVYDENMTASIGLRLSLEANMDGDDQAGTLTVEHDLVMSGLAGAETSRTWRGTILRHSEGLPPQHGGGHGGPDGNGPPDGNGGPPNGPGGPGGGPGGPPPGGGNPPQDPGDPPDFSDLVVDETNSIDAVAVPFPLGEETWPLSGTITHVVDVQGGPNGDDHRESVLEFNGTRYASLTIDGETREIDLLRPPRPPRQ